MFIAVRLLSLFFIVFFTFSCALIPTQIVTATGGAIDKNGNFLGNVTMNFDNIEGRTAKVDMIVPSNGIYNGSLIIRRDEPRPGPYPPYPGPYPPYPGPFPNCSTGSTCDNQQQQFVCANRSGGSGMGGGMNCPDFPPHRDISHQAIALGYLFSIEGRSMSCRFYLADRVAGFLGGGIGNCNTLGGVSVNLNLNPVSRN